MQNKGAIQLFAIALALVSLYQLSFTWVTNNVRKDAVEAANGDFKKELAYLDSISTESVYNFLWFKEFTYQECLDRELNLGLDLKGGMNVTLEISVVDLIRSLANNSKDPTFVSAIKSAQKKQKDSQDDFVNLFGQAFEEVDANARLAAIFHTRELQDKISQEATNEEVLKIIREEVKDAMDNSFNILRSRIDRFGVSQPNIQRLEGNSGRVLVELPGVKDPDRVRKLLQGTANLEFWQTYDNREIFPLLSQANEKLRKLHGGDVKKEPKDTTTAEEIIENTDTTLVDTAASDTATSLLDKIEGNETTQTTNEDQSFEDFAKENPLWSVLKPSANAQEVFQGAAVGYAHFKDTAKVNAYLKQSEIKVLFPRTLKFLWQIKPVEYNKEEVKDHYVLVAIKASRSGNPALTGDVVTNARSEYAETQASAEVSMQMNSEGAKKWARITKENVGKQIAIVLDNYVYSYPVVRQEISGGNSQISGDFTIAEAKDLANILKSGKMPAPARIIEEEIVGPSLGEEAINSGMFSFLIAFLVVLLYMIFYYKNAGIVSDIALIANIFFIFGVLASLGAVLTLPGIAGIVLTIGMSVDANVLIYERIREEMAIGKNLKNAISDGYKNSYSAIIDANLTTLLTGIILYIFGHGPIKGFATTLIIGILTSLFAAIFLTRLVFTWLLNKEKTIEFASKLTKDAFKNTNIQFLAKRKIFYIISGVVILLGVVSLFTRGLNQGVDFKGGRTYVVRFDENVTTKNVAQSLQDVYDGDLPEVKTFGGDDQVKITTKYMIDSTDVKADSIVEAKLYQGLKPLIGDITFGEFLSDYRMSSQKVGPTIADDIKVSAVYSIIFSLVIIFLYILIRFKNWQFGLGALAALIHDTLIVLGLFSMLYGILPFSLEIDQAFIAAILTVVGYSINDTVVVFDRIRELLLNHKKKDTRQLYNEALNSTLSRTFSTSLSTFFVLLSIFIFGGEVIRGFIFALLIGIVVGTYSSLFIATPVVFDTAKKIKLTGDEKKKK